MTTTKAILALAALAVISATPALACSPAPTCWMGESKDYLRSICKQHVQRPLDPGSMDEPEQVPAFVRACKKVGFTIKVASWAGRAD
jgi:hypothetical protein